MWFLLPKAIGMMRKRSSGEVQNGKKRHLAYCLWRFLQFVAGIVVLGLYCSSRNGDSDDYKIIMYGTAVGTFSTIFALLFSFDLPPANSLWTMGLDWVTVICYVVLISIWAPQYLSKQDSGVTGDVNDNEVRLHHAVYVDLAAMVLWILAGVYTTAKWWAQKKGKSSQMGPSEIPIPNEMAQAPYKPM